MAARITPWLGATVVAASAAAIAVRRTSTHRAYPPLDKRPRPKRTESGPFMRFLAMVLFVVLALLTVGYLLTGGKLDWLKAIGGFGDVPASCLRFMGLNHDGTEYWMLFAAALLAGVGLLLSFGMEHDSNAAERWRAYAVLRLTGTGLISDGEAVALIAPTIEVTWKQRYFSMPARILIPDRMTAALPGGRRADLTFNGDAAALQVTDARGVTRTADFR